MKTACEICGTEFEAVRTIDKYCSDECRRRANYKRTYAWQREHYAHKPAENPSDRCVFETFVDCLPEERAHGECGKCGWNPKEKESCVFETFVDCLPEERAHGECGKCGWNPEEKERRRHDEKYRGRGQKAADDGLPDND